MKKAFILFTRTPVPGKTKTRLQTLLTPLECAELHTAILKDLSALAAVNEWNTFICYTPAHEKPALEPLFPESAHYLAQTDGDLGARMSHALEQIFLAGFDSCILAGTDIPSLSPGIIHSAFHHLKTNDIVLGPTEDRGYYMVGMKKLHPSFFSNQTYGSGDVLGAAISIAQKEGLRLNLVQTLRDIDEPEDLACYASDSGGYSQMLPTHTKSYITDLKSKYKQLRSI